MVNHHVRLCFVQKKFVQKKIVEKKKKISKKMYKVQIYIYVRFERVDQIYLMSTAVELKEPKYIVKF